MTTKWWSADHFIFEEYKTTVSGLGIYRILFAAYILFVVLPQHLWVPNFPDSFFDPPPGLMLFFTGFPGTSFFLVVNGLAILAATCLLFGYRTRIASTSFAFLLLICNSWGYSLGKIDHDIFLILTPLIMQFAGWGKTYSMDAKRNTVENQTEPETTAWPIALMTLMVGMAMMSAAAPKAATGWLNPHLYAVRAHIMYNDFVTGRSNWFAEHALRINSRLFWKALDYSTVLIEASFLLTVVRRRAFRVACAVACFFHLGIGLTMEITFVGNILAYGVCFEWSDLESRGRGFLRLWNRLLDRMSAPLVLGSGAAVAFVYLRFGNPLQLPQEWDPIGILITLLATAIAGAFLVGRVRSWIKTPRQSVILFDG
jgi:hypothetical protein